MAECPGVLHLAAMADGALARVRTPGGRLTSAQARAVADAASRLGSSVIDLTNRANLQIRGLAPDAGPDLADALAAAGLLADGPADRRRNILVDPYAGLDPTETRDLRSLAKALDEALTRAPWIGGLSPKFSFVFDGGGLAEIAGVPSDVTIFEDRQGLKIGVVANAWFDVSPDDALDVLLGLADAAASTGPDARGRDLDLAVVMQGARRSERPAARSLKPMFGAVETRFAEQVAATFPVPVGRLSPAMLKWLADVAERDGEGALRLAPWSAVVVPGLSDRQAQCRLEDSESLGFPPVAIAERLRVIACAGAPACERAQEPAKALAADLLALAAAEPSRLPHRPATVHLSACPKGCAGSAPSDLLLLGSSDQAGWTVYADSAPRSARAPFATIDRADPADILRFLSDRTETPRQKEVLASAKPRRHKAVA